MEIRTSVDSALLDKAEEDIYEIVLNQHLSYNDRWFSSSFATKVIPAIRIFGLSASILGLVLSVYILLVKPEWCPVWMKIEYYVSFFLISGLFFYFLLNIQEALRQWNCSYAYKNCKKIAGKCVREARKQVPYVAQYKIKDNKISYYRNKNDESKLAWTRKLKGIAYYGAHATVFFRKWTSFMPKIILLHEDFSHVERVLSDTSVQVKQKIKTDSSSLNQR